MNYDNAEDKLSHARKLFEDSVDHAADAHLEAHRAERFYHNSECEGQWEADDLKYLRENQRVAWSFNVIKPKIDVFLGMYADAQRTPTVAAAGGDDGLLADVVNVVKDQILQDAKYERLSARQLKTGTIAGECSLHLEVEESDEGPGWLQLNLYRILPFELHWDIASVEPDRSDARYVFWDRWLSKEEFAFTYPEHKNEWEGLTGQGSGDGYADHGMSGESGMNDGWGDSDYAGEDKHSRYYYDRQKRKVRVIRYEFKTYRTKHYAVNTVSGERSRELEDGERERIELAASMGEPLKVVESKEEVVEVCEFAGHVLLAEYDTPGPFKGFSIVPYCYDVDEETGTAYGLVRNLFDPQQELNKSKSLEVEYLAQATAPGTIAEEDSIPDENEFEAQRRRPGGVRTVAKDALMNGRVQDTPPPQPSAAVMARAQGAIDLLNEISTIPSTSNLTAAEHAQAGVTVAIKYHKSRQSVSDPFAHFEGAQKALIEKVVQVITEAMPDDQIEAVLANESRFSVQGGVVVELSAAPDGSGQMVPKSRAALRDLRGSRWNLDMAYTSENSTLRMLDLEMLLQIQAAGFPVPPELVAEKATSSRADRQRFLDHVEKVQRSQAEGAQAESEAMQRQADQFAQIEAAKAQETARHNQAQEALSAHKQESDAGLKAAEIWERGDEAEKAKLEERFLLAARMQHAAMTAGGMNGQAGAGA